MSWVRFSTGGSIRAGAAMRSHATLVGGLVAPRLKMVAASSCPTEEALGMGVVPEDNEDGVQLVSRGQAAGLTRKGSRL